MKTKPHLVLASVVCLLLSLVFAQDKPRQCPKPTTESKKLSAKILIKNQTPIEIVGQATVTITALNTDDSLEGIFTYTLSNEEQVKIAQALNKRLDDIPSVIHQKEVIGQFHKLTECPVLQLDFPGMELEIAGVRVRLDGFTLTLKETDKGPVILLCTLARRLNRGLDTRGPRSRHFKELVNCQENKD
ncbi:MAG: hypothetical protein JNM09_18105 [Blastocatellia bacterium]|nr:hypothetical protein [Blastocatellia bacterium]